MACLDPNSSLVPTFPGRSCFISLYHVWKAGMKIILSLCLLNVTIVPGLESQADHRSKQNWLYLYHSSNASSGVCKQNPGWKVDQILDDSFAFPFAQTQKHSTRNSLNLFNLFMYLFMNVMQPLRTESTWNNWWVNIRTEFEIQVDTLYLLLRVALFQNT